MGAWDTGIFDDDAALDMIEAYQDINDPTLLFTTAFELAIGAEFLHYDECHSVTVAAACIDSLRNGTTYNLETGDEDNPLSAFVQKNKALNTDGLTTLAVRALEKVISDQSELNELWQENEEHYPAWKNNIEALIKRLQ